jgi:hypothetical protein
VYSAAARQLLPPAAVLYAPRKNSGLNMSATCTCSSREQQQFVMWLWRCRTGSHCEMGGGGGQQEQQRVLNQMKTGGKRGGASTLSASKMVDKCEGQPMMCAAAAAV